MPKVDRTKKCSRCGEEKSVDCFSPHKRYKDGLNCWCKPCCRDYGNKWQNKNRTIPGPKREKYLKDKRERLQASKYSISVERLEELRKEQIGLCALCGEKFDEKFSPAVDHCHDTGVIRGLLHHRCNVMIGMGRDNPELLRLGAEYLERHATPTLSFDEPVACSG